MARKFPYAAMGIVGPEKRVDVRSGRDDEKTGGARQPLVRETLPVHVRPPRSRSVQWKRRRGTGSLADQCTTTQISKGSTI